MGRINDSSKSFEIERRKAVAITGAIVNNKLDVAGFVIFNACAYEFRNYFFRVDSWDFFKK